MTSKSFTQINKNYKLQKLGWQNHDTFVAKSINRFAGQTRLQESGGTTHITDGILMVTRLAVSRAAR